MLVNYARESGVLTRDEIGAADFESQAAQLAQDGLDVAPGLVLALRSSSFLTALRDEGGDEEGDWPEHSSAERVRLSGKGRVLFEHCLAEESHVCVTGFMEYEKNRAPGGARFLLEFIGWMLEERSSTESGAERAIVDQMIDFGLVLLYRSEGDLDGLTSAATS